MTINPGVKLTISIVLTVLILPLMILSVYAGDSVIKLDDVWGELIDNTK